MCIRQRKRPLENSRLVITVMENRSTYNRARVCLHRMLRYIQYAVNRSIFKVS